MQAMLSWTISLMATLEGMQSENVDFLDFKMLFHTQNRVYIHGPCT